MEWDGWTFFIFSSNLCFLHNGWNFIYHDSWVALAQIILFFIMPSFLEKKVLYVENSIKM
jgi:hypothetical protein